jgi:radical SAM superfamily enzyme YgiQ (UPF0313 family)
MVDRPVSHGGRGEIITGGVTSVGGPMARDTPHAEVYSNKTPGVLVLRRPSTNVNGEGERTTPMKKNQVVLYVREYVRMYVHMCLRVSVPRSCPNYCSFCLAA